MVDEAAQVTIGRLAEVRLAEDPLTRTTGTMNLGGSILVVDLANEGLHPVCKLRRESDKHRTGLGK